MAANKQCSACKEVKPVSEFYPRGDRDAPRSQCKSCMEMKRAAESERHAARAAAWRDADPERARASVRASWKRHKPKRNEAQRKKWHENDEYRERETARTKNWREENRDRFLKSVKLYGEKYRERYKKYLRDYVRDNPDKYRAYRAKRRSLKLQNKGSYTDADVLEMRKLQGNCCAVCRFPLHDYRAVDHIRPLSKGGSNHPFNLQLLCVSCNSKKRNKDFTAFLLETGLVNVDSHQEVPRRPPA